MVLFDSPEALFLLFLPVGFALLRLLFLRGWRPSVSAASWAGPAAPRASFFQEARGPAAEAAFLLGLCLFAVAAAGPQRIERVPIFERDAEEVLFAIDVSPSMSAKDVAPSRFEAARSLIRELSRSIGTAGLVCFGSEAALACPPTPDDFGFEQSLDSLRIGEMGDGTSLGDAVAIAAYHLGRSRAESKIVIAVTDGECNAGKISAETAFELARSAGIVVHLVGVGSSGDAAVDYVDPTTGETISGSYKSGYDAAAMRALASGGRGRFFQAADAKALAEVFSTLPVSRAAPVIRGYETESEALAEAFAKAAIACILLALVLRSSLFGGLA